LTCVRAVSMGGAWPGEICAFPSAIGAHRQAARGLQRRFLLARVPGLWSNILIGGPGAPFFDWGGRGLTGTLVSMSPPEPMLSTSARRWPGGGEWVLQPKWDGSLDPSELYQLIHSVRAHPDGLMCNGGPAQSGSCPRDGRSWPSRARRRRDPRDKRPDAGLAFRATGYPFESGRPVAAVLWRQGRSTAGTSATRPGLDGRVDRRPVGVGLTTRLR
jgi:hypothetical protein